MYGELNLRSIVDFVKGYYSNKCELKKVCKHKSANPFQAAQKYINFFVFVFMEYKINKLLPECVTRHTKSK